MANETPNSKRLSTRFALLLGVGCVACCALPLPLIGAATGLAVLAGIAAYLEIALGVGLISIALVAAVLWFRRRHAPVCAVEGPCAPPSRQSGDKQP